MDILASRPKRKAEVNIVPLVDVLTVLIFFFLLTMQFKSVYSVDITPPKMRSAAVHSETAVSVISVSKDGKYFFDGEEVSLKGLEEKLKGISGTPEASVILLADRDSSLKYATDVIDLVKLSKIRKLSLQTIDK